ncbi:hypothetical protein [Spongiimicrobium salis]|uniref:hypothetical protein n=1 Tax=Spongiimicrobium salis TaxID=1667022 RepID=UPI00374CBD28
MKKLKEGDPIGLFVTSTINGREVRLKNYKGKKLYLVFSEKLHVHFAIWHCKT